MSATLRLGYVPLLDAAPLILAEALGFAEEEGLHLDLQPAPSWSQLRDMLAMAQVDAAHMLAPLPVALALGLGRSAVRFEALSVLNLNGNVIGVSQSLAARLRAGGHDFDFADATKAGQALLAFDGVLRIAVPFAFSMHRELMLYWLQALGADLTRLEIKTVPPSQMAAALAAEEVDVFCVGEPWGSVAVEQGAAMLLLPGAALWARAPEKVLATRTGWAETEPQRAGRLLRSVWRSGRWLGQSANHGVAAEILTAKGHLAVSAELLERALSGRLVISPQGEERHCPNLVTFSDAAAGFPWRSQAAWIGAALARHYRLNIPDSSRTAAAVFRSDLYRLHLRNTGAELPGASEKLEGAMSTPAPLPAERGQLILPADRFFDARIFDPHQPDR